MKFPFVASASLLGLYILIQMVPKNLISGLLNINITFICTYVVGQYLTNMFSENKWLSERVWLKTDYKLNYFIGTYEFKSTITDCTIAGFGAALVVNGTYLFNGNWVCNNIIGITMSVGAIALLKTKDFGTGLLILWGLFFYDIFWVFKTDVMVAVARNLNSPIKLQFPMDTTLSKFSILGLGDMIIPGCYVAQALKFDIDRFLGSKQRRSMTGFNSFYFYTAMIGYSLSILTTFVFMTWFNHAQPALLYIVPFLSVFTCVPALVKKEWNVFWTYDSTSVFAKEEVQELKAGEELKKTD